MLSPIEYPRQDWIRLRATQGFQQPIGRRLDPQQGLARLRRIRPAAIIGGPGHPRGELIQVVVQGFRVDRRAERHAVHQPGDVDERKGRIAAIKQQTVTGLNPADQIRILHRSTPLPRGSPVYPGGYPLVKGDMSAR